MRRSSSSFVNGYSTGQERNPVTVPDHESPGPTGGRTSLEAALHRIDADLTRSRVPFALISPQT